MKPADEDAGQIQKPGEQAAEQAVLPLAGQGALPPDEVADDAAADLCLYPAADAQADLPDGAFFPQGGKPLPEGQQ